MPCYRVGMVPWLQSVAVRSYELGGTGATSCEFRRNQIYGGMRADRTAAPQVAAELGASRSSQPVIRFTRVARGVCHALADERAIDRTMQRVLAGWAADSAGWQAWNGKI